jgi:hypothetical protein
MPKLDDKKWKPARNRKPSDDLLREYCLKQGGVTFAEVTLVDDPYPRPREIDGVRFLANLRRLETWSANDPRMFKEFQDQLYQARRKRRTVEVIEVTPRIDRGTIGQVVVGAWLLEQQKVRVRKVLVCREAGAALKELLAKHDIEVWSPSYCEPCSRTRQELVEGSPR